MAKILLVEDDKSLREIYGVRLMAEGYDIVSAGDGEEALAMAIRERPDLIISDVMMPKISGFDMLDILRSTTETKDVKVIMMTALSSEDQRARGEALGADRYLVKSQVGIEDVVRTVHEVIGDSIKPEQPVAAPAQFGAAPAVAAPDFTPVPPTPVQVAVEADSVAATPFEIPPAPIAQPEMQPMVEMTAPVAQTLPVDPPAPVMEMPIAPAPVFSPMPEPITAPAGALAPAPMPTPVPAPVEPEMPQYQAPQMPQQVPQPAPAPVFTPTPEPAPIMPAGPPQQPAPVEQLPTPQPVADNLLPQPTAPFSSPAPASLGERIIEPLLNPAEPIGPQDIAAQMANALGSDPNNPQPPTAGQL